MARHRRDLQWKYATRAYLLIQNKRFWIQVLRVAIQVNALFPRDSKNWFLRGIIARDCITYPSQYTTEDIVDVASLVDCDVGHITCEMGIRECFPVVLLFSINKWKAFKNEVRVYHGTTGIDSQDADKIKRLDPLLPVRVYPTLSIERSAACMITPEQEPVDGNSASSNVLIDLT